MKNFKLLFLLLLFSASGYLHSQQYSVIKDPGYNSIYDLEPYCIADDGSIYKYVAPKKIAKYSPAGYLDVNFGVSGVATIPDSNISVMKFYDNSIYVIISNRDDTYLSKYSTTGILDTTFGNNGTVLIDNYVQDCMVNSDGSIYITGYGRVKRLLSNGSYDANFTMINTGYQFTEFKRTVDDSLIYLFKDGSNTIIKKNLSTGATDLTFGNNGVIVFDSMQYPESFFVNKLNEVFLVLNDDKTIRKLKETGSVDNDFGSDGNITIDYTALIYVVPNGPKYSLVNYPKLNFDSDNNLLIFARLSNVYYSSLAILRFNKYGDKDNVFTGNTYFRTFGINGISGATAGDVIENKIVSDNEYLLILRVRFGIKAALQSFKYKRVDLLSVHDSTNDNVLIYPNPATDVITVVLKNNEIIDNLKIYAMDGKLLTVVKNKNIDVSHLSAGNYILEIVTSNGVLRKKIIKK